MTIHWKVPVSCPHCGLSIDTETDFCRWMRRQGLLASSEGIVRTDMDHIVHRYKTPLHGREHQLIMIVEVKIHGETHDTDIGPSQRDTLKTLNRIFLHSGKLPFRMPSERAGREVLVRYTGMHLLQFSGTDPENSEWIKWDRHKIDKQVLIELLALERHPDNPSSLTSQLLWTPAIKIRF